MSTGPLNGWGYTEMDDVLDEHLTRVRQCWAFNKDGIRCEHPAGHPGDHVVMASWSDEECYAPGKPQPQPMMQMLPTIPVSTTPSTTVESSKCVGCNHSHRGGPCKCGCYEFIG